MFKNLRVLFKKNIINPIQKNITLALLVGGAVAIFFGTTYGTNLDGQPFLPAQILLKAGIAVIGAGVFAVILKSAQFIEVFQNHLFHVLYNPEKIFDIKEIKRKWLMLTERILESTLPASYRIASENIQEQFFDSELQYHFDGYNAKYNIHVNQDGKTATITQTTHTNLIVSPNQENPVFTQELMVDGSIKLISLIINGNPQDISGILQTNNDNARINNFVLPLEPIANKSVNIVDKIVVFERTYEITQDLTTEPYLMATIKRYTKGLTVRAKIGDGYKIQFLPTGLGHALEWVPSSSDYDGEGFQYWVLAKPDQVILPGQGFVLMVIPE